MCTVTQLWACNWCRMEIYFCSKIAVHCWIVSDVYPQFSSNCGRSIKNLTGTGGKKKSLHLRKTHFQKDGAASFTLLHRDTFFCFTSSYLFLSVPRFLSRLSFSFKLSLSQSTSAQSDKEEAGWKSLLRPCEIGAAESFGGSGRVSLPGELAANVLASQ